MFTTGIHLLTTAAVLFHSIVGCCSHSGHEHAGCEQGVLHAECSADLFENHCDEHDSGHFDDDGHLDSASEEVAAGGNDSHSPRRHHDDSPCDSDTCLCVSCAAITTAALDLDGLLATGGLYTSGIAKQLGILSLEPAVGSSCAAARAVPPPRPALASMQTWLL